jgi:hypothetical protein
MGKKILIRVEWIIVWATLYIKLSKKIGTYSWIPFDILLTFIRIVDKVLNPSWSNLFDFFLAESCSTF